MPKRMTDHSKYYGELKSKLTWDTGWTIVYYGKEGGGSSSEISGENTSKKGQLIMIRLPNTK